MHPAIKSNKIRAALLLLCAGVFIIADQIGLPAQEASHAEQPKTTDKTEKIEGSNHKEEGSHHKEGSGGDPKEQGHSELDHSDPENQRRMGIFHYNEGNKLMALGKAEQAVVKYQKALNHHPKLTSAFINLSSAYMQLKHFDLAHNTLKTLETQEPDNLHLHYNYACLYALTGKMEESLTAIKQSVKLGLPIPGTLITDPDLAPLRETTEFKNWYKILSGH
jgi:tetratricopeptide (TPR) repeat protein